MYKVINNSSLATMMGNLKILKFIRFWLDDVVCNGNEAAL